MKPAAAHFVLILIFCTHTLLSQTQIAPPPLRTPGSLHPMPLIYTGTNPDIYLPGDSVTIPHIRTHIVEFNSAVQFDHNFLIEGLRRQGTSEGVDGIILSDYRKMAAGPDGYIGSLSGIGIKYLDRLQYIDTILKQKVITVYDPHENKGKTALIDFDWYGRILNNYGTYDVFFYADSMAFIDLNILFNRIGEFYEYRAFTGHPVHKIVTAGTWPFKITHTIEPFTGAIPEINTLKTTRIQEGGKDVRVKTIPVYTGKLLTGAIVNTAGGKQKALYYLHYKYDSRGRLTEERWEKLINGKRTLWLEVENRYFEADAGFLKTLTARTIN